LSCYSSLIGVEKAGLLTVPQRGGPAER
jgi:hypothetical protein